MVLEATVVCLDTSDWMRNGDFAPTRLDSQQDAANLVCSSKLNSNPESSVALMSLSGRREVLLTLTTDMGKVLTKLHGLKPNGTTDFVSGIQVATLMLKHRQSKNQRQRIVAFVGSPIEADEAELVKLAKKLKKNNVSVDVVNFGEEDVNTSKLEAFVQAVNNKESTSHLVTVPSGARILSDALMGSPIVGDGEGGSAGGASGAGGQSFAEYGGIDPNMDPELAMALRVSMMEERERMKRTDGGEDAGGAGTSAAFDDDDNMDPELANALRMSVELANAALAADDEPAGAGPADSFVSRASAATAAVGPDTQAPMDTRSDDFAGLNEEEQIALALKMSMGPGAADDAPAVDAVAASAAMDTSSDSALDAAAAAAAAAASLPATLATPSSAETEAALNAALSDPAFLADMLAGLPGVDPNDAEIQAVLAALVRQSPAPKK